MAQERYDLLSKDYDDDYEDYSDDYDEEDLVAQEREGRRGNSFSGCSGNSGMNEVNEDSRKDHHNQLERKRRASIKSSYTELREALPSLRDNKASRSVILQRAVEYLEELGRRSEDHVACVEHFTHENSLLENKCRDMENQVQILLRQQRQNGGVAISSTSQTSYQNCSISLPPSRSPFLRTTTSSSTSTMVMMRDEEDSNELTGGSTNSTPTASTSSRSITSNEASIVPPPLSSEHSVEFQDDLEDVSAPKKSRHD